VLEEALMLELRGDPGRACRHMAHGYLRGMGDRSVAPLVLDCLISEGDSDVDLYAELLGSLFEEIPRSGWHRKGLLLLIEAARMNGHDEALRVLELHMGRLDTIARSSLTHFASHPPQP
jgi:hypothetical protein